MCHEFVKMKGKKRNDQKNKEKGTTTKSGDLVSPSTPPPEEKNIELEKNLATLA